MITTPTLTRKPLFIYDADCGFCQNTIRLYQKLNIFQRILCIPLQNKEILEKNHISFDKAPTAIHFCTKNGKIYRGARAFNAALDGLIGGFPIFTAIYYLPIIHWTQNQIYAFIAKNRYRLPGSNAHCTLTKLHDV